MPSPSRGRRPSPTRCGAWRARPTSFFQFRPMGRAIRRWTATVPISRPCRVWNGSVICRPRGSTAIPAAPGSTRPRHRPPPACAADAGLRQRRAGLPSASDTASPCTSSAWQGFTDLDGMRSPPCGAARPSASISQTRSSRASTWLTSRRCWPPPSPSQGPAPYIMCATTSRRRARMSSHTPAPCWASRRRRSQRWTTPT